MDAFVSRKRPRLSQEQAGKEDDTDFKLAVLASLNPSTEHLTLLETLLSCDGSVELAKEALRQDVVPRQQENRTNIHAARYQSSLTAYRIEANSSPGKQTKLLTKKGKTLHLYSPQDVEVYTPCSLVLDFLSSDEADALLIELLPETETFKRESFKLFDNLVQSPHSMCFYVDSLDEAEQQKTEYVYNGSYVKDVRKSLPEMRKVAQRVKKAVNLEIKRRIQDYYPNAKKLQYQSPHDWTPNASFVNCYDGPLESVGYHSDQLTYIGPRAIIGSLSLGVTREFRVRRVVPRDSSTSSSIKLNSTSEFPSQLSSRSDFEGQIAIHLPHNSLLVMHAEMQEEWKHCIAPSRTITPHSIAGNKRINITYRWYKEHLHPRFTPRCKCGIPTVLRCVQKKRENRGKYMWMCHANYTPGKEGCSFFQWAKFDNDGEPLWTKDMGATSDNGEREFARPGHIHQIPEMEEISQP